MNVLDRFEQKAMPPGDAEGWVAGLRRATVRTVVDSLDDRVPGLAAPLVLLLWVYVSAIAVLLGAELNAEIERIWPSEEGPYDSPQARI